MQTATVRRKEDVCTESFAEHLAHSRCSIKGVYTHTHKHVFPHTPASHWAAWPFRAHTGTPLFSTRRQRRSHRLVEADRVPCTCGLQQRVTHTCTPAPRPPLTYSENAQGGQVAVPPSNFPQPERLWDLLGGSGEGRIAPKAFLLLALSS